MKRYFSIITIVLTFLPIGFNRQESEFGTIHDIDGNIYKTVKIGNQWWIDENLRVTRNPQDKPIKGYYYMDDPLTYGKCGMLYTWKTAMDGSFRENAQGIAPDGWHIPSAQDWEELVKVLGGEDKIAEIIKVGGSKGFNAYLSGGADFNGRYAYFDDSHDNKWDKFAAKKNGRIHIRFIKDNGKSPKQLLFRF